MRTKETFTAWFKQAVADHLGYEPSDLEMDGTVSDHEGDDLDAVEIIMTIEDELATDIPDEGQDDMTLQELLDNAWGHYEAKHGKAA